MDILLAILVTVCYRADHLDFKECYNHGAACIEYKYSEKKLVEDGAKFAGKVYRQCTEDLQ